MGILDTLDLQQKLDRATYDKELESLQTRLKVMTTRLYQKGRPVIFVFEGKDAAGKGGAIRRLTQGLLPEVYIVNPVAAPSPEEKARHYLWRFWNQLPTDGRLTVFDRSWYGRVLVERVEGFTSKENWKRSYGEIVDMERSWDEAGIILAKFWLEIDADEQLERFNARAESPLKHWKLTDEDWRNREKNIEYTAAIEEMIEKTSTGFAPWYLIEANDKLFARVKVLRKAVERLENI